MRAFSDALDAGWIRRLLRGGNVPAWFEPFDRIVLTVVGVFLVGTSLALILG